MASFGKDIMEKEFIIDYRQTFLNQGSFGVAPKKVYNHRINLLKEVEEQPDLWFRRSQKSVWDENIQKVAEFLRSKPENLLLVNNATTGINAVLRSYPFQEGDGILLYVLQYFSVRNTSEYLTDLKGLNIYNVDFDFPIESVQQVLDAYEQQLIAHPNIKMVIIDHISSMPAVLLPITGLIALCRRYNKVVLVDGAHAPGHVDLNLEDIDADFYVGNLHKWAYAPRGCAVLWVHPSHHKTTFPVVTARLTEDMDTNFSYMGPGDYTLFSSATKAIEFYREIGGIGAITEYCSDLATRAANLLVQRFNTRHLDIVESMRVPFMRAVRLPDLEKYPVAKVEKSDFKNRVIDIGELQRELWDRFQIIAACFALNGEPWVRISASVYNEFEDYEKLATAVLIILGEEKK